jgi:hypothetical protein
MGENTIPTAPGGAFFYPADPAIKHNPSAGTHSGRFARYTGQRENHDGWGYDQTVTPGVQFTNKRQLTAGSFAFRMPTGGAYSAYSNLDAAGLTHEAAFLAEAVHFACGVDPTAHATAGSFTTACREFSRDHVDLFNVVKGTASTWGAATAPTSGATNFETLHSSAKLDLTSSVSLLRKAHLHCSRMFNLFSELESGGTAPTANLRGGALPHNPYEPCQVTSWLNARFSDPFKVSPLTEAVPANGYYHRGGVLPVVFSGFEKSPQWRSYHDSGAALMTNYTPGVTSNEYVLNLVETTEFPVWDPVQQAANWSILGTSNGGDNDAEIGVTLVFEFDDSGDLIFSPVEEWFTEPPYPHHWMWNHYTGLDPDGQYTKVCTRSLIRGGNTVDLGFGTPSTTSDLTEALPYAKVYAAHSGADGETAYCTMAFDDDRMAHIVYSIDTPNGTSVDMAFYADTMFVITLSGGGLFSTTVREFNYKSTVNSAHQAYHYTMPVSLNGITYNLKMSWRFTSRLPGVASTKLTDELGIYKTTFISALSEHTEVIGSPAPGASAEYILEYGYRCKTNHPMKSTPMATTVTLL